MTQGQLRKEAFLKNLVVKLLRERNFSDILDSLFKEVNQELQNQDKTFNSS